MLNVRKCSSVVIGPGDRPALSRLPSTSRSIPTSTARSVRSSSQSIRSSALHRWLAVRRGLPGADWRPSLPQVYAQGALRADREGWVAQARLPSLDATAGWTARARGPRPECDARTGLSAADSQPLGRGHQLRIEAPPQQPRLVAESIALTANPTKLSKLAVSASRAAGGSDPARRGSGSSITDKNPSWGDSATRRGQFASVAQTAGSVCPRAPGAPRRPLPQVYA